MSEPVQLLTLPTLTEAAKGVCGFQHYEDGYLHYILVWVRGEEPQQFAFTVPVADAHGGKFTSFMKGLNLMRWIRPAIDEAREAWEKELH